MISCVIPAYNEVKRLDRTLKRVSEYFGGAGRDYEIIVVDDGSNDGTADLAARHGKEDPRCRVVSLATNSGKGAAVRRGVLEAKGELILFSDADLSTPIEEVEKLESALAGGYDVAIGSRALPGSQVLVHQPWVRETMGKVYNILIRLLLMRGFRDTQCGFKLFKCGAAKDLFPRARIDRFGFDVEILLLARLRGYRVAEVPVRWINSPATRVMILRDSTSMFLDLFRIRAWHLLGRYRG